MFLIGFSVQRLHLFRDAQPLAPSPLDRTVHFCLSSACIFVILYTQLRTQRYLLLGSANLRQQTSSKISNTVLEKGRQHRLQCLLHNCTAEHGRQDKCQLVRVKRLAAAVTFRATTRSFRPNLSLFLRLSRERTWASSKGYSLTC